MTNSSSTPPHASSSTWTNANLHTPTFGCSRTMAHALSSLEGDDCARWIQSRDMDADAERSEPSSSGDSDAGDKLDPAALAAYRAATEQHLDTIRGRLVSILTLGGARLSPRPAHLYPGELYAHFLDEWHGVQWLGARLLETGINLESIDPELYRAVVVAAEEMECDLASTVARLLDDVEGYYRRILRGYGSIVREEEEEAERLKWEVAGDMTTLEARLEYKQRELEAMRRELERERSERMALESLVAVLPGEIQRELAWENREVLTADQRRRWGIP